MVSDPHRTDARNHGRHSGGPERYLWFDQGSSGRNARDDGFAASRGTFGSVGILAGRQERAESARLQVDAGGRRQGETNVKSQDCDSWQDSRHLGHPEAEGLAGGSDVVYGHALEGGRQCGERGEGRRIPRLRRHSRERPGTGLSRRVESGTLAASMNVWLHKQVLIKIAENGDKVPPDRLPDFANWSARTIASQTSANSACGLS